jgi:predicted thioesterase
VPVGTSAVGRQGRIDVRVDDALTADRYGNAGLQVLATPALVGLFEQAAMRCLDGLLDGSEMTVGSRVEITHTAPTAVGGQVTVTAALTAVNGRELVFAVEAADDNGPVGGGTHSRFVVDRARFEARVHASSPAKGASPT